MVLGRPVFRAWARALPAACRALGPGSAGRSLPLRRTHAHPAPAQIPRKGPNPLLGSPRAAAQNRASGALGAAKAPARRSA